MVQHFRFPLSITMTHLITKFIMAACIRGILYCKTGKHRVTLGWVDYIKRIAPPGTDYSYTFFIYFYFDADLSEDLLMCNDDVCALTVVMHMVYGNDSVEASRSFMMLVVVCLCY